MAGHSKWSNIKHKKAKTDAQRAKIFTKIGKEISVAIREGGPDPATNSKLRDLITKAKSQNVPNDNIDRIIKRAVGDDSIVYEEITYEGYGPGGVAVIVEVTTDNRNRAAGEVRHIFDKYGGNLGVTGSVGFLFTDKGIIVIEKDEEQEIDGEKLMETAIMAGAEDFSSEGDVYEITTDPAQLSAVRNDVEAAGYEILSAEVEKIPSTYITLSDEEVIKNMQTILDNFDDNDDVTDVYHNWENSDEE